MTTATVLAKSLTRYGHVLTELGQHRRAQNVLDNALAIEEKTYGRGHKNVAIVLDHMGASSSSAACWVARWGILSWFPKYSRTGWATTIR
ncbi:MAG: tetratricopeptide repeat protein [Candidatus Hydrogenedentes bacterium]|nr:tetratricopeptide repeat protein [Candidatus Hydrogenedentota bacterium]